MTVAGLATLAAGLVWLSFIRRRRQLLRRRAARQPGHRRRHGDGVHPLARPGAVLGRPARRRGLAAGIVNTNYQIGSALGLAAMTAVAAAFGGDGPSSDLVGLTDGYSAALIGAAAIAAVGAVVAAAWLRTPATQTPAEVVSDEQVAADSPPEPANQRLVNRA